MVNGALFMNTLRGMVLRVALADRPGPQAHTPPAAPAPSTPRQRVPTGQPAAGDADPQFDRPIFIVSPPRAGSTLLFETLAQAPGLFTIGHESHALIEGLPGLHPAAREFDSNRLDAAMASPELVVELRRRVLAELRDRDGRPPVGTPLRLLEKTPKNALRVPFLARVFPAAHFVYLHRDPRQTLSSMLEAWQSGRFRTYPQLPEWGDLPWSLLLVPGWRDLRGHSLPEIVAAQWETTTRTLLDDLAQLPPERCHSVRYDTLVGQPDQEIARLCHALDLEWDRPLDGALALSRFTLSPPATDKWQRHAELLAAVLPSIQPTAERATRFAASTG
jgi:hypothetical protein